MAPGLASLNGHDQLTHASLPDRHDTTSWQTQADRLLPPVMEIPELVEAVLLKLERPQDLLSMACTARRYKDLALRIAWTAPDLGGSPLVKMASLFPENERKQLLEHKDTSARIPPPSFSRFDYYAHFIRELDVWHQEQEAFIAKVMMASRPDKPLFPSLQDLHVGATGKYVETIRIYLAPSIRSLRMNHWDLPEPERVNPTDPVKASLLSLCNLRNLCHLDLLDTRYPCYENDADVVSALIKLAPQLHYFHSYDFTTLLPVCRALSQSRNLEDTFLDLCNKDRRHIPLAELVELLRDAFVSVRALGLLCDVPQACQLLQTIHRPLQKLDLRIDGSVTTTELRLITSSIFAQTPCLRSFRCSSLTLKDGADTAELPLKAAVEPLKVFTELEELDILISFCGAQMLNDEDMTQLFRSWPRLRMCLFESDPDGESIPDEDEPVHYGLSLRSLVSASQFCPELAELRLPFLDTSIVPPISGSPDGQIHSSFALHIGKTHVHDRRAIGEFVASLWPNAEVGLDGCCELQAARFDVRHLPPSESRWVPAPLERLSSASARDDERDL